MPRRQVAPDLSALKSLPLIMDQLTYPQQKAEDALTEYDTVILRGGNRLGKSRFLVRTGVLACLSYYEWCPTPSVVGLVSLSREQGRDALQDYINEFALSLPEGFIKSKVTRDGATNPIIFYDNSRMVWKTAGMSWQRIQGMGVNLWLYDENPESEQFWKEGRARMRVGAATKTMVGMTPTSGKDWFYRRVIQPCIESPELAERRSIKLVQGAMWENGTPPCLTCGRTRAEWAKILPKIGMAFGDEACADSRFGGCPRCRCYGVEPRYTKEQIDGFLSIWSDPAERRMRAYGDYVDTRGAAVFWPKEIEALRNSCKPGRYDGGFTIWSDYDENRQYVIGVDCAEGLGGDHDETCVRVVDAISGEDVAVWGDNETPVERYWGDVLVMAQRYHAAVVCIEKASEGHTLINRLSECPEVRLYEHRNPDKKWARPLGVKGWIPSTMGREKLMRNMIAGIRKNLRKGQDGSFTVISSPSDDGSIRPAKGGLIIRDLKTVSQLETLYYNEEKGNRIYKTKGYKDDRVDALRLCHEARMTRPTWAEAEAPVEKNAREEWEQSLYGSEEDILESIGGANTIDPALR